MTDREWASIVVYCDGGEHRHNAVPMAAYQRSNGEWLPIHSALFNGEWVVMPNSYIDGLVGKTQLPTFTSIDSQREQIAGLAEQTGNSYRTQYRWRCDVPACPQNVMANDHAAIHRLFDLLASAGQVALAQIQNFQRDEAAAEARRRSNPC